MCTKLNLHGARWQQIYHYTCQTYASSHHHIYQSFYLFFYLLFFLNNIHCPKTKSILQRNQNQNQINKKINFLYLAGKKKNMASSEEKIDSTTAPTDDGFTYADEVFVDGEMLGTDPGTSRVDPADYTTSKQLKVARLWPRSLNSYLSLNSSDL